MVLYFRRTTFVTNILIYFVSFWWNHVKCQCLSNLCPVVDRRLIVPVLIPWGEILLVDVSLLVQYKLDYPRSLATQANLVKCFILTIADLIPLVLICRKLKPFTRSS